MSGPMPDDVRDAATALALKAEADARGMSVGRVIAQRLREGITKRTRPEADSLPARVWRDMHLSSRTVLVMLCCDAKGDPRQLAMQSWDAFGDADKGAMAACARSLASDLRSAASLW